MGKGKTFSLDSVLENISNLVLLSKEENNQEEENLPLFTFIISFILIFHLNL